METATIRRPSSTSPSNTTTLMSQQSCCCIMESIWASLFFLKNEEEEAAPLQKVRDAYFHQEDVVFELSQTKKDCQQIQSNFQRRFDESDYSQRYEKYGSRAHFIRDRNSAFATGYVRQ